MKRLTKVVISFAIILPLALHASILYLWIDSKYRTVYVTRETRSIPGEENIYRYFKVMNLRGGLAIDGRNDAPADHEFFRGDDPADGKFRVRWWPAGDMRYLTQSPGTHFSRWGIELHSVRERFESPLIPEGVDRMDRAAMKALADGLRAGTIPPLKKTTVDRHTYQAGVPHWVLSVLAAPALLPALLSLKRQLRARRRRRLGLCVSCGYDLRGTTGRCPECGAARTDDPAANGVAAASEALAEPGGTG